MKNNQTKTHGESFFFPSSLPKNIKKKKAKNGHIIVADSESTGNHHVIDVIDGVDFYEDEKGTLFMESSVETNIRCVHADRHDTLKIPAGTYEFGTQQEYNPFEARMQNVRD